MVIVTGEPGIGKTSLVTRFVQDLGTGARVLFGTCDDLSIPRPLGPIRDLVGGVSPSLEEALARRRRPARDPAPADRGAGAAAAADGARARGRPLGRRRDARLDHRARAADRLAAGPARADLPRRRGVARPPASRRGGCDPCRRLRLSSSSRRCRRAPSPRSPATTPPLCTPPSAATRSTSPSCSARGRPTSCRPRSRTPCSGRASRLDDTSRGLVELVSVVPSRVRTSVLDAVMPDWPAAAEEPERQQLLEVDPRYVRFRHELARNAIRVEHPDRAAAAACTARSSTRCSSEGADPADIVHHAEAAGAEDVVAEYALVAARRAAALDSNREAYSHYRRAADFVDRLPPARACGACSRSWRPPPTPWAGSRTRSPRSSRRSRASASWATRGGRRPVHADPVAVPLVRRRRRRGAPDGARGGRDPRAARRVGRARPRLQRGVAARDARGRRRATRSSGASRRSTLAIRLGDESARAHALVNIGSAQIQLDDRETATLLRGARDRRRGRGQARGGARPPQPRATR